MSFSDLSGNFRYYKRFHCLYLKNTAYTTYEDNYSGRVMSYASSYFCCRIRPEGVLYDAERDILATAKFLVFDLC